ncbi:MAG: hypothetical protein H6622_13535 [Halobacteriovoraceae bacterium]|nr:hypothetical protein [Halobacteriovoraceae bacterium]
MKYILCIFVLFQISLYACNENYPKAKYKSLCSLNWNKNNEKKITEVFILKKSCAKTEGSVLEDCLFAQTCGSYHKSMPIFMNENSLSYYCNWKDPETRFILGGGIKDSIKVSFFCKNNKVEGIEMSAPKVGTKKCKI